MGLVFAKLWSLFGNEGKYRIHLPLHLWPDLCRRVKYAHLFTTTRMHQLSDSASTSYVMLCTYVILSVTE